MRCPNAPGNGGLSKPGSSRPNLTHITIRGMMKTPGECYDIFLVEYYKKQGHMSNMAKSTHLPRVLFFGTQGRFSYAPLRTLLEAGIQVCAVVIPAEQAFEVALPAIDKLVQLP